MQNYCKIFIMPNKKRQHLKPEWGYDKELKAILNDTQYADYEKIKLHQIMALMHTKRLVNLCAFTL